MPRSKTVKVIGTSGQITLGKQYAGKTILVEEVEKGVWLLKIARVIPDNEVWLHTEPAKSRIDQAITWAAEHTPQETDLEILSAQK
jgi:putative transposon-encoded protein